MASSPSLNGDLAKVGGKLFENPSENNLELYNSSDTAMGIVEERVLSILNACKFGDLSLVEKSLKHCDINFADKDGWTALHEAAMRDCQYTAILKLLLNNGAKVDALDQNKSTPLYWAVLYHCYDNVKLLVSFGANINQKNDSKLSPLSLAKRMNDTHAKMLLLQKPLPELTAEKKIFKRIRIFDSFSASAPSSTLKRKNTNVKNQNNKRHCVRINEDLNLFFEA